MELSKDRWLMKPKSFITMTLDFLFDDGHDFRDESPTSGSAAGFRIRQIERFLERYISLLSVELRGAYIGEVCCVNTR